MDTPGPANAGSRLLAGVHEVVPVVILQIVGRVVPVRVGVERVGLTFENLEPVAQAVAVRVRIDHRQRVVLVFVLEGIKQSVAVRVLVERIGREIRL